MLVIGVLAPLAFGFRRAFRDRSGNGIQRHACQPKLLGLTRRFMGLENTKIVKKGKTSENENI
jgi:hypothetical protein